MGTLGKGWGPRDIQESVVAEDYGHPAERPWLGTTGILEKGQDGERGHHGEHWGWELQEPWPRRGS